MSSLDETEGKRRAANIVLFGTIASVEYPLARVAIGDLTTGALPMLTTRAGGDRTWWPYEVGEAVAVLAPSGELAGAVILGSLYTDDAPAPADGADMHRTVYANGSVIEFDRAANHYKMNLSGGTVEIVASGGVSINGTVTVVGDVIADGVSLKHHVHSGILAGPANTGEPVK